MCECEIKVHANSSHTCYWRAIRARHTHIRTSHTLTKKSECVKNWSWNQNREIIALRLYYEYSWLHAHHGEKAKSYCTHNADTEFIFRFFPCKENNTDNYKCKLSVFLCAVTIKMAKSDMATRPPNQYRSVLQSFITLFVYWHHLIVCDAFTFIINIRRQQSKETANKQTKTI